MIWKRVRRVIGLVLTAAILAIPMASQAVVIDVMMSASGTRDVQGQNGTPVPVSFSIIGGFTFDSDVTGATNDLSNVGILDPGISDFSFAFTGFGDVTFSDPTLIASGAGGSFDLSSEGTFSDIVNSFICIEDIPGGNGGCGSRNNPAAVLVFSEAVDPNPVTYIQRNSRLRFRADAAFTVDYRDPADTNPAPIPLPAAGLMLLSAFAGICLLRRRHAEPA